MKKTHIIAIIIIAAAIGAIISTVSDASTYASFTTAASNPKKEYHVVGRLNKEKEMYYNPSENSNLFSFYLIDNEGKESKVVYSGTKPNDFERAEQIVIIGKMEGADFAASGILMKCPSKYANSPDGLKEIQNES